MFKISRWSGGVDYALVSKWKIKDKRFLDLLCLFEMTQEGGVSWFAMLTLVW